MYEENRRFSWTSLFIKIIIVVIFILFTIWLLSLSMKNTTKGLSDSLNVLTDNIFKENIDRMKDVGKEYFTTERLPEKIGEVKTLTLEEMYKKNLILEVKDKNGKACSAKNSYVSIEKMETEYQMKVYLECGSEKDFIKVIMGCYNYCNTDICEKKDTKEITNQAIEYQYSKTTGGSWGPWGAWSDWSTVEVTKNNYRDVETKVVNEQYSYDKDITENKYAGEATCEIIDNYKLVSSKDGVCSYKQINSITQNPVCPKVDGYVMDSQNGFTCNYRHDNPTIQNPVCPKVDGYTKTNQDGFTCSYKQTNPTTQNPVCPKVDGYTKTSQDGFTCTYKQTDSAIQDPKCPELDGYGKPSRDGFTCTYSRSIDSDEYEFVYYDAGSGTYIPADTDTYHYVQSSADYQYRCDGSCAFQWYYTYTIYKKVYKQTVETTTRTATCDTANGYVASGNTCVKAGTTTRTATCDTANGYVASGSKCVKYSTTTRTATCDTAKGFVAIDNKCVKYSTTTRTATCDTANGFVVSGNKCVKANNTMTKNAVCENGQNMKNGKCYISNTTTVKVIGYRDVTYYRYRLRSYTGGTTDYKWSSSNNDRSLLDAGYRLTGKTRNKEVGGK